MRCCKGLKELIMKMDLFKTTQYFRYKGEPEYQTLTGGLCSLVIVIVFIAVFSTSILSTLSKSKLSWSYDLIQNTTDSFTIQCSTKTMPKFMFAVGIDSFDMNQGQQYFNVKVSQVEVLNGTQIQTEIQMQKCNRSNWQGVNEQIMEVYDRLDFSRLKCPAEDQVFELAGSGVNANFRYIKIAALNCSTNSNLTCANSTTIDNYLLNSPNFNLKLYFVNGLLNPSQPQEITYYLQDRNYVPFNTMYGGSTNIYMSRYSFNTDQSIMPYEDEHQLKGGIANFVGQYLAQRVFKDEFATIRIRKSHVSWDFNRHYTKIDDTLSYIGGLFGFLMIAFVFMQVYTQYSFQIEMGAKLYYYDNKTPLNANKFHFLSFLGYLFYCCLDFFCCSPEWQTMKKFDHCRDEIKKQFDISFLMRRIIFFQRALRILFEDHQFKGLHMHEKMTLKQAQELRSYYVLRDRIKVGLDDGGTKDIIQGSDLSASSNNQQEMNRTDQNIFDGSYLQPPLISDIKVTPSPKYRKVLSFFDSQYGENSGSLKRSNQIQIQPRKTRAIPATEPILQTRMSKRQSEIQRKLNMLRKESECGNPVSRKIFQGVNSDLVNSILQRIQEGTKQAEKGGEIIICEHEEDFQIRISKRKEHKEKQDKKGRETCPLIRVQDPPSSQSAVDIVSEQLQVQSQGNNSDGGQKNSKKESFDYI